MTTVTLYGIPNCDTMKKARSWLAQHDISYHFHNYKTDGISQKLIQDWCRKAGIDTVLNRRGTTWRKLDASLTDELDEKGLVRLMTEHPSLIRRPVLVSDQTLLVGFKPSEYETLL